MAITTSLGGKTDLGGYFHEYDQSVIFFVYDKGAQEKLET